MLLTGDDGTRNGFALDLGGQQRHEDSVKSISDTIGKEKWVQWAGRPLGPPDCDSYTFPILATLKEGFGLGLSLRVLLNLVLFFLFSFCCNGARPQNGVIGSLIMFLAPKDGEGPTR